MGNGDKEDPNQDMYGALEKNKKQVKQGQCNVDTKNPAYRRQSIS